MNKDKLDDIIYDIIYETCQGSEVELDGNRIEVDPGMTAVQEATRKVLIYVEDYVADNFIDLCKKISGMTDKCELCEDRFNCWVIK